MAACGDGDGTALGDGDGGVAADGTAVGDGDGGVAACGDGDGTAVGDGDGIAPGGGTVPGGAGGVGGPDSRRSTGVAANETAAPPDRLSPGMAPPVLPYAGLLRRRRVMTNVTFQPPADAAATTRVTSRRCAVPGVSVAGTEM